MSWKQTNGNWEWDDIECPICGWCLIERDHAMSTCPGPQSPEQVVLETQKRKDKLRSK